MSSRASITSNQPVWCVDLLSVNTHSHWHLRIIRRMFIALFYLLRFTPMTCHRHHISKLLPSISQNIIFSHYSSCQPAIALSHSQHMISYSKRFHLLIFLPLGQIIHSLNHRQSQLQPSSPDNYWCATNVDIFQQLAERRRAHRILKCYQSTAPLSNVPVCYHV